ncbi:MAG: thiamine pyrophosphate-binding protein, partial [Planctomycetes bacterium]|nr:thiamine pyrophosphate-binding protein [Planctomycetota bacterium]
MKLSQYVMDEVAQAGVGHIFLVPGGGAMHLVDSLGRHPNLEPIAMLHEQGACIAADAYAQYRNDLGVCLVTTGPGGTNAITAVAAAWLDSTPLLIISGQVKRDDFADKRGTRQFGFQEIDITTVVRPITKWAVRVDDPTTIREVMHRALHLARSDRPGPVWIDIPLDVQAAEIPQLVSPHELTGIPANHDRETALDSMAASCITALLQSKRPLILVGNGLRLSRGESTLHDLLEKVQIPVQLSWKALDLLPSNSRLNAGRPGIVSTRYANLALQTSDFVLVLGARLDMGQTAYRPENLAPEAKKFIVDIDKNELTKANFGSSELIEADAVDFLKRIVSQLSDQFTINQFEPWLALIDEWKVTFPLANDQMPSPQLTTFEVVQVLSDLMEADDVFVPGSSGACSEVSMQAFQNKTGQRVFNSEGLGPMGFGIAAPIGAWFASGGRRTFSIDGDGGFMMNVQELEVARRFDCAICWIVLDNDGYGSIKATQDS